MAKSWRTDWLPEGKAITRGYNPDESIFDSRCGSFANRMRQGALQTALAVTIGLLLSLAAGRVLAQILYQVSPSDPFALVASGTMLAAAALLACFFPPRRATYVEPLHALRTE